MACKSMRRVLFGLSLVATAGCGANGQHAPVRRAVSADSAEWVVLFDGQHLDQWRGYQRSDVPAAWRVENGALAFVPGSEGGDLVTRDQFGDFELELEWKISEGGNSGIFYRAGEDHPQVWESAPEMQVLDDARHPDGRSPLTSAGANYALYPVTIDATRPVGEWNRVRIVARGNHIEHWLNGRKVVEYEIGSPEWKQLVARSKFGSMPAYGQYDRGHIALQDHGDRVWYRDIRIRPLDGAR